MRPAANFPRSMNLIPLLPRCRCEHAPISLFADSTVGARAVAAEIAALIRARQRENRPVVLGLATGSTPVGVYAELVRLHRDENLSFANVISFNLDEYYPLSAEHEQSYRRYMQAHLFSHLDMRPENIHIPGSDIPADEVDAACVAYERAIADAGGIDFQLLGIGRTGHIGFNEPGSSRRSVTRLIALDPLTRRDAANDFGGEAQTPRYAITMGVQSILQARRIVLLAWGEHKAPIVRDAIEGEPTPQITASFLQEHDNAVFVLDEAAAEALTRRRTPWVLGPLEDQGLAWDERVTRRAILWLAQQRKKALLKLTEDDYNEAGLQDLLRLRGSAYEANRIGFYQMQHTITGWPGGRDPQKTQPGDAPVRPLRARSASVFPKRVLIFSPHPDDDVISMGGTLCRLVEHGHEVHIAYQVSGHTAVSDEAVWRALLFATDGALATGAERTEARALCSTFEQTGKLLATNRVKTWKGWLRRHETIAAARVTGVPTARLHYLDLPFYEADTVRRRQLGEADVQLTQALLQRIRPHLIYAAGDLDDPHGTHRICLHAIRDAIARSASEPWYAETEVWLYRGAWAEWGLDEIDLAVPLSPEEVMRRRRAVFRHETQKDQALFLGNDRREFWQRTEDRSRKLADAYNALGLAEYEAIEAFRRYPPDQFVQYAR